MFSDPWVFMKRATGSGEDEEAEGEMDYEDLKDRIPLEIQKRSGTEKLLQGWLNDIPEEDTMIDEAVERVQMLVLKTYDFIRSHVCDQVEMLTDTFFKTPMLRRLQDDMLKIEISEDDKENYRLRRENMDQEMKTQDVMISEVDDCIKKIQDFKLKNDAISM